MKTKSNGGFSLIETLVAIVLLGAMVVPTCTALVMSIKINDKADKMLQAQLAVSSAVEILMAEGIKAEYINQGDINPEHKNRYEIKESQEPNGEEIPEHLISDEVDITAESKEGGFYEVIVTCNDIAVTTHIRAAKEGS